MPVGDAWGLVLTPQPPNVGEYCWPPWFIDLRTGLFPFSRGLDAGEEVKAEGYCFPPAVVDDQRGEPMSETDVCDEGDPLKPPGPEK